MKKESRRIRNRSGKAECDMCEEKHILEEHHIRGRKIPNPNHPSNICNICPNCHTNVHAGEVIIEDWIRTMGGLELMWHKKGEESFTGNDAIPHIITSKTSKPSS